MFEIYGMIIIRVSLCFIIGFTIVKLIIISIEKLLNYLYKDET